MRTETGTVRAGLALALDQARAETDRLFSWLEEPGFLARPIPERHRFIFYLGHLEAFDWNLLARDIGRRPSRRQHFEHLFAFGIDPVDGGLPTDTPADWPSHDAILAWSREARAEVDEVLRSAPMEDWLQGGWAAHLAIEHREMHVETLAYLLAKLPPELKRLPTPPPRPQAPPRETRWCEIPDGMATLGLARSEAPTLGWDNEYEAHTVRVPPFRIASHKVTCGQWLGFLEAGGYRERKYWRPEDQPWLERSGLSAPGSWRAAADGWRFVGLAGEAPLDLDAPVYVSYAEAAAYAKWRGALLPTEAQWQRAVYGAPDGHERAYPWGEATPHPGVHGNFGGHHFDPTPVGAHPAGRSAFGLDEPVGNGWEWTSTPFGPFQGFQPLPFYKGYSEPFFDGQHFVMKGASPRTPGCFLRRSFRNWFQPHYPHVFATVRLVEAG